MEGLVGHRGRSKSPGLRTSNPVQAKRPSRPPEVYRKSGRAMPPIVHLFPHHGTTDSRGHGARLWQWPAICWPGGTSSGRLYDKTGGAPPNPSTGNPLGKKGLQVPGESVFLLDSFPCPPLAEGSFRLYRRQLSRRAIVKSSAANTGLWLTRTTFQQES